MNNLSEFLATWGQLDIFYCKDARGLYTLKSLRTLFVYITELLVTSYVRSLWMRGFHTFQYDGNMKYAPVN